MIRSLLTANCSDIYNKRGDCMRYQASLKVGYHLATKVEYIAAVRRCTYLVRMKSIPKDYAVSKEVLTLHFDNLRGISIFS